jgi:hypothetical protein
MMFFFRSLFTVLIWLIAAIGFGHRQSDSFARLSLSPQGDLAVQLEIALRDLEGLVGLDSNADSKITWSELKDAKQQITAVVLPKFQITSDSQLCSPSEINLLASKDFDRGYAVLAYRCDGATFINLSYQLLFAQNAQHRGVVELVTPHATQTVIFTKDRRQRTLDLRQLSVWRQFYDFLIEGIWHIWIGIDHILFLLVLLLPGVVQYQQGGWRHVDRFGEAFWDIVKVVTSFTVAHSLTLIAVTLGVVSLPSRLVESVIAASVAVVAVNNLMPMIKGQDRWMIAFGFGLIHGFGFASVLAGLGLSESSLLAGLIGFNVGVEVGQLVIVAALLPVLYHVRVFKLYRPAILIGGSLVILMISLLWLVDRAFDIGFMPF